MRDKHFDFVVIGSGSSGAVTAWRLQQGGAKVLLLESGAHYKRDDFPMPEYQYAARLFWGGGVEFNTHYDLALLRARCVGGTSVVNGALMDRLDDVALNDWRQESGIDFFTEDAMDPWFQAAEDGMVLQEIPDEHRNNNARLFIRGMENIGHVWKPLRRCQSDCASDDGNDCISCLGGCHRDSKQSTLVSYVPKAVALGMDLLADFHVTRIEHQQDGVTLRGTEKGAARTLRAPRVVLACGALGNTQLLLNSGFGKRLPALGSKFCMHPQFMNFAVFDEPVDAHKGVLQGAKSLDPDFRRRGFKLENVFAPPISVAMLFKRVGKDLHAFMRRYRHLASMEVAVRDENTGVITVNNRGRVQVRKRLTDQDRRRAEDGHATCHKLFESLGPREIIHSPFYFGLHLMGGCPIGVDPARTVFDPSFQMNDHPHLYCADSSVFPNAPGINPALSIMALSHKMASELLRN